MLRLVLEGFLTGAVFAAGALAVGDNLAWAGTRIAIVAVGVVGAIGRVAFARLGQRMQARGSHPRLIRIATSVGLGLVLLAAFLLAWNLPVGS